MVNYENLITFDRISKNINNTMNNIYELQKDYLHKLDTRVIDAEFAEQHANLKSEAIRKLIMYADLRCKVYLSYNDNSKYLRILSVTEDQESEERATVAYNEYVDVLRDLHKAKAYTATIK